MLILSNKKDDYIWEFRFNGFNNDDEEDAEYTKAYATIDVIHTTTGEEGKFIMVYNIKEDRIISLTNTKQKNKTNDALIKKMASIVLLLDVELREYFKFASKIR